MPEKTESRILGIDYGTKRVGLALSDPMKIIAQPLDILEPESMDSLVDEIGRLVEEHSIRVVVIGMPVRADGSERGFSEKVKEFGMELGSKLAIEIVFWDERFSTQQAERAMREADLDSRRMRGRTDSISASLVLQTYLDHANENR
jgi:putative Holliday junction resolvase